MRARPLLAALGGIVLAASSLTAARASDGGSGSDGAKIPAGCATTVPGGGNWRSYGADVSNSRSQPAETTIDATKAATLAPRWVVPVTALGASGQYNSTPIVADGCVFAGTSNGDVVALNADTGHPVWTAHFAAPTSGLGGTIVGATVVDRGRVFALIDEQADGTGAGSGPYAVALDESTGKVVWRSARFHTDNGDYTNASPAIIPVRESSGDIERLLFAGWSPAEGNSQGQGGFVLINATSGRTVVTTETIPKADQAQGYAGGGIWSAPAYDPSTGYGYIGASNPYSKTKEHPYTNALLKIDLDPSRTTFGSIVGSYKGNVDQYNTTLQALGQSPACVASDQANSQWPLDDPVCGQLDLDFGAAPNLFHAGGHTVIGGLQKAGVYHAADAATMGPLWQTIVGGPCAVCNAASTAVTASGVFGVGTPGGVAFGLAPASGARNWSMPLGGGAHYESISTANGVVYTFDTEGFLDVLDATTGVPLLRRPMAADTGAAMVALTSAGVAIARHTVFVATNGTSNGYLIAYQPTP